MPLQDHNHNDKVQFLFQSLYLSKALPLKLQMTTGI